MTADGLSLVEWSGAQVQCSQDDCPRGGGLWRQNTTLPGGRRIEVGGYARETLELASGTLHLSGRTAYVVVGAGSMNASIDGWVRLPLARTEQPCDGCPDGETLRVEGNLSLNDLRPVEEGRGRVDLSGVSSARIDEALWLDLPWSGPTTAVAAATGAVGIGVGLRLLWVFLVSRQVKDPLAHPNRRRLYEYVVGHPGPTFREVVRESGMASGTVRHHLTILVRAKLLAERRHRSTLRFFENHGRFDRDWIEIIARREPALCSLYDWIAQNPGSSQGVILDAMFKNGWSRSTSQHRLKRLVDMDLVRCQSRGRYLLYETQPKPA